MNLFSYLNGISIALYFAVCLLCGLQLVGHIFGYYRLSNSIVSRLLGWVLLTWAGAALLYIVYAITRIDWFALMGSVIDVAGCVGLAWLVYVLYADPERHSTKWLITFACMYAVYWAVRLCFSYTSLSPWCDAAIYSFMTMLILFAFTKVCTLGESVSLETQQQIAEANQFTSNESVQQALVQLMEKQQIYLRPDLTIEDVALRLNTQPKYLSAVLNNEMHTSFTKFINHYRIEHAKHLLQTTDDKVEYIGSLCGYNSRQVFIHAFTTLTGKTPSEWRK